MKTLETKKLEAAEVSRAGRTARTWNHETDQVELVSVRDAVCLTFSLGSKGGGITDVKLTIGADDFAALASAMASANRGRATREMAATVASEIAKQSDYDTLIVREARESVADAAENAYMEAPQGHDRAEKLLRDMIRELVDKLNESDANNSEDSDAT